MTTTTVKSVHTLSARAALYRAIPDGQLANWTEGAIQTIVESAALNLAEGNVVRFRSVGSAVIYDAFEVPK